MFFVLVHSYSIRLSVNGIIVASPDAVVPIRRAACAYIGNVANIIASSSVLIVHVHVELPDPHSSYFLTASLLSLVEDERSLCWQDYLLLRAPIKTTAEIKLSLASIKSSIRTNSRLLVLVVIGFIVPENFSMPEARVATPLADNAVTSWWPAEGRVTSHTLLHTVTQLCINTKFACYII